jgi:hypothetical protein
MGESDTLQSQELLPVEDILQSLGFERNDLGGYEKNWGPLTLSSIEWLGGWHFIGYWIGRRTAGCPEFRAPSKVVPASLLAALYANYREAFQGQDLPTPLIRGKQEWENEIRLHAAKPPAPTVWADREFFRFCLSYIEKGDDWSSYDYPIKFAVFDHQLKFESKSRIVFCPARGQWSGPLQVQAKDLYRRLPKRFMGEVVALRQHGEKLLVGSQVI